MSAFSALTILSFHDGMAMNGITWLTHQDHYTHPFEVVLSASAFSVNLAVTDMAHHHQQQEEQPDHNHKQQHRIFIVFSTGCSKAQDWQSQALIHSHKIHNISSYALVRLLSCQDSNYLLPRQSHPKYRVIRTPDFNSYFSRYYRYSPRNRPASIAYWLGGLSDDEDIPQPDDIVVSIDPDQIFTSNHLNVSTVSRGHGIATLYGISNFFLRRPEFQQHCPGRACEPPFEKGYNPSYGHPQILTAYDALRHAQLWYNLTNDMKINHKGWETEMYSNVIAARLLKIHMQVEPMMISYTNGNSEDYTWNLLSWDDNRIITKNVPLFVLHYCQKYQIDSFIFSKKKVELKDYDLQNCQPKNNPRTMFSTEEDDTRLNTLKNHFRNQPLVARPPRWSLEEARGARTVWMLDKAYKMIQQALIMHYDEFCK